MDLSHLPLDPQRRGALEARCAELRAALGADLRAVVAHGDAVTGEGLGELAGLEVLLVVRRLDRERLDPMAGAVAEAVSVPDRARRELLGRADGCGEVASPGELRGEGRGEGAAGAVGGAALHPLTGERGDAAGGDQEVGGGCG